jgi:hypothetical protein
MSPKELEIILIMQIKELKSDLANVSYEISTRSLENTISFKQEKLESVQSLIAKKVEI